MGSPCKFADASLRKHVYSHSINEYVVSTHATMSLVGAPLHRAFAKVTLDGDVDPLACSRARFDAFLASITIGPDIPGKPPVLVCTPGGGTVESTFHPKEVIGSGGFGRVWLYTKVTGPSAIDEVCLKVITRDARVEAGAITRINTVNANYGAPIACETIHARVLRLLPDGMESLVLMRKAAGSLARMEGMLRTAEVLDVVEAVAIEVGNAYATYGLLNQDIKAANFLYSVTSADTVEVCVSDLGSLRRPDARITANTFRPGHGYDAYARTRVTEELVVFQLATLAFHLSAAAAHIHDGGASYRQEVLAIESPSLEATNAFRAAIAYGFQCGLDGVLIDGAGDTGVTIDAFIKALRSTGDPEATLRRLRAAPFFIDYTLGIELSDAELETLVDDALFESACSPTQLQKVKDIYFVVLQDAAFKAVFNGKVERRTYSPKFDAIAATLARAQTAWKSTSPRHALLLAIITEAATNGAASYERVKGVLSKRPATDSAAPAFTPADEIGALMRALPRCAHDPATKAALVECLGTYRLKDLASVAVAKGITVQKSWRKQRLLEAIAGTVP